VPAYELVRVRAGDEPDLERPALVVDRSRGGLLLWLDSPLRIDSLVFVRGGERPGLAKVRHCQARLSGVWAVGCKEARNGHPSEEAGGTQAEMDLP
jgi:hypothetical protein